MGFADYNGPAYQPDILTTPVIQCLSDGPNRPCYVWSESAIPTWVARKGAGGSDGFAPEKGGFWLRPGSFQRAWIVDGERLPWGKRPSNNARGSGRLYGAIILGDDRRVEVMLASRGLSLDSLYAVWVTAETLSQRAVASGAKSLPPPCMWKIPVTGIAPVKTTHNSLTPRWGALFDPKTCDMSRYWIGG